mgnify:CR=1 FL=1
MKDERIEQATNKIKSELALLMYGIVVISFVLKSFVYNMDLSKCLTEYIIMIITPLYQFIRARSMKVSFHDNKGFNQSFRVVPILFIVIIAIFGMFIYKSITLNNFDWKNAVFILIFIVLFVFIHFIATKSEQKQVKKYEKQFDDDNK